MSDHVVGRAVELAQIQTAVQGLQHGHSAIVTVCGEPGIGKTTVARAAMEFARASGMATGWGTAPEAAGCPPYWPFHQVIHALDEGFSSTPLLTDLPVDAGSDDRDRWELFQSVANRLRRAAAEAAAPGLLVVLDDVQWADRATLRLLEHLITHLRDDPVALLLLHRDTERAGIDALRDTLVAVARHPRALRLRLTGLTHEEIGVILARIVGAAPDPEWLSTVSRRSRGNPFYVTELGRLGVTDAEVPAGVRDVVLRRLDILPPSVRALVQAAAMLGPEFEPSLLADAAGAPLEETLEGLDRAVMAGLLTGRQRFSFSHDLVRECVYDEVGSTARLFVHRRAAESLIAGAPQGREREIAWHLLAAGPTVDPALAATWAAAAGEQAVDRRDWEGAAAMFASALDLTPVADEETRARLLLELAGAEFRSLALSEARETLTAAADAAHRAGRADLLAQAALELDGVADRSWLSVGAPMTEAALAGAADLSDGLRARLLSMRAIWQSFTDPARARATALEALALAEQVADPGVLLGAVRARQVSLSHAVHAQERLDLSRRLSVLARDHDDDESNLLARLWAVDARLQLGQVRAAEAELPAAQALAGRLGQAGYRWNYLRAAVAVAAARGDLPRMTNDVHAALSAVTSAGNADLVAAAVAPLVWLSGVTGDRAMLGDFESAMARAVLPEYRTGLCWWNLHVNGALAAEPFYDPDPVLERIFVGEDLIVLAMLADVAAEFDDRRTATRLYELLEPAADLFVAGGSGAICFLGSTRTYLGRLADVLGHRDSALRLHEAAVAANDAAGAPGAAAVARLRLAQALARRGNATDLARASAEATLAARTAAQLGMHTYARMASPFTTAAGHDGLSRREREVAELIAQGLTNKQVAATLHLSERTVESHVAQCLRKLGVTSRTQIAVTFRTHIQ